MTLAVAGKSAISQKKDAERRDKMRIQSGKNTPGQASRVKNFQAPAMLKTTPLDCEKKCNLRVKRRDPWFRANAPSKAVADPEPVVKTRTLKLQACLDLVGRPVAQPSAEAG
jgi:hypothetical protein